MTDVSPTPPPEGPDLTAAEFALGVLDGADYRAAAARLTRDGAFAGEVASWEARLGPLAAEVAPVTAPASVWPRIAAEIGADATASPGLWNNLVFWRGATVAGLAVAAAALVVVMSPSTNLQPPIAPPAAPALQPIVLAKLAPSAGKAAAMVAALDPNSRELVLTSVSLTVPAKNSPELWIIPKGQAPISLGVMDLAKPYRIPMPAGLDGFGRATATLAVTAEQLGGSPDGAPHGPIVAAGTFS